MGRRETSGSNSRRERQGDVDRENWIGSVTAWAAAVRRMWVWDEGIWMEGPSMSCNVLRIMQLPSRACIVRSSWMAIRSPN